MRYAHLDGKPPVERRELQQRRGCFEMFGRSGTIACLCFAALAMSFAPTDAIAQLFTPFCSANSDCGDGFICRKDFFFFGECKFEFCNTNRDCTRPGSVCDTGICRGPAGGSGTGSGTGTGPAPV